MEQPSNFLPTLNAFLNALSTVLLSAGWLSIRYKNKEKHKKFMIAAVISSALFLFFYVLNRIVVGGLTHYQGKGIWKVIYFSILIPHTILAIAILPFIGMALWHAFHLNFRAHVAITRWLLPVWLYVSVTGVVIYFMLFGF